MKPLRRRIAKDFHEKLLLLLAGILLYLLIDCWSQVWALTSWVLNILTPFFVGIGLAYLLDIPVRALESHGVKKRGVAVSVFRLFFQSAFRIFCDCGFTQCEKSA